MSSPVSVITNDDHRSHDPEYDVYSGTMVGRFEAPERRPHRDALEAGVRKVDSTSHGMEPILRCTTPISSTSCRQHGRTHDDPPMRRRDCRDVHPSRSRRSHAGRSAAGDQRLRPPRWFCFDTSSPLSEDRGRPLSSVDIACRVSIGCWLASEWCTRCAARPVTTPLDRRSVAFAC